MLRLLALLCLLPAAATAQTAGPARVLDGDTVEIAGRTIGLYGIDAPELEQSCQNRRGRRAYPCGEHAIRHLRLLIGEREVACDAPLGERRGRPVAVCRMGAHELAQQLVLEGWALADPDDGADYRRAEQAARGLKHGLWKGRFVTPWAWRDGERLPPPEQ